MSFFDKLEELVINYNWKPNTQNCTTGFRKGNFSENVGYTCHWNKEGKPMLPTRSMKKNPHIYNECKKMFPDFDFDTVIINKNLLCPPHKDANNIGDSIIIGLGNYEYGDFVIEGEEFCIWHSPVIFNGSEKTHWTEKWTGDRYSVILCKSKFKSYQQHYKIVIPSYNRVDIFKKKTFQFLERHNLTKYATLFLQTDEDEEQYKQFNISIVRSPLGLIQTINFIYDYYPLNTKLWLLHDDINKFIDLNDNEPNNINKLIIKCFKKMEKTKANLCGFYPTANTYFMKKAKELTTDCKFIYEPCSLIINKRLYSSEELAGKSDFERTILYFENDKIILRYNHYAVRTLYNPKSKGGFGFRNNELEKINALLIKEKYPQYVKYIKTHKNGSTSIVLKNP